MSDVHVQQKIMKFVTSLLGLMILSSPGFAGDDTVRFEKYNFSVKLPKGWHLADTQFVKMFSAATHKGVVAHARQKSSRVDAAAVESAVLLLVAKHPLGAKADNPNVTISVEKSWKPTPQNTGDTYLKLLAERFTLFKAPSQLKNEPTKAEIGGVEFYFQDAVNDKIPDVSTRQQYITTYVASYYVTFIISYNDKKDADYRAMKALVESFTVLKRDIQPSAGGDAKPATHP